MVIRAGLVPQSILGGAAHSGSNQDLFVALRDTALTPLGMIAFVVPFAALAYFVRNRKYTRHLITGIVAMIFSLFFVLDALYLPMILNGKSDKPLAEQIARLQPEGKVYSYRAEICITNRLHPFTINFYLNNRVVPFDEFKPEAGYLITGGDDIEAFKERVPEYQVAEAIDFDHKSCDDRRMTKLYRFDKR